ncbi:hypothetical protein AAHC03_01558 [Spirometra sp. Aus1]
MTSLFWIYSSIWLTASPIVVGRESPLEVVRHGPGSDMRCMSPLMDTEDKLPDSAFTASSVYRNTEGFQPHHARLIHVYDGKEHTSGHAWCPSNTVQTAMKEWIQVEFPTLVIIGIIFTAGRGDGNVKEFMPSYVIHYQREDEEWFEYKKSDSDRVIEANSDPRTIIRNTLDPAIVARRLRIYPYSARVQQQICLRFSLYGCEFRDGIVEYSLPEGVRGGGFGGAGHPGLDQFDFRDTVNDRLNAMQSSHNVEGLGKLVDNIAYLGNVTRDIEASPGSHFVGWDSGFNGRRTSVQLRFKFDGVRNFSAACLFAFDSPKLRASLFKRATVDFSDDYDDRHYAEERRLHFSLATATVKHLEGSLQNDWRESIYQQLGADNSALIVRHSHWDGATIVVLPLKGRLGRSVRLDLGFADTWLLLSEIEFISVPHVSAPGESPPTGSADETVAHASEIQSNRGNLKSSRKADHPEAANSVRSDSNSDSIPFEVDEDDMPHSSTSDDDTLMKQQLQNRKQTAKSEKASSNGHRNLAFVAIVIACSLFTLAVLGVGLAFCFHMRLRQTRNKQQQSLKKIASDASGGVCGFSVNDFGGRVAPSSPTGGAQVPSPYLLGPTFKAATVGTMHSAASMGDGKSPYSNLFHMFSSPAGSQHAPLSVFAAAASTGFTSGGHEVSGNAVRDSGAMATAFQGLPSPGHAFVGGAGDLNSLSMCQPAVLAMQMGGQHPAIFFSAPAGQTMPLLGGTGLIHPGGDTTTDSGSLYTTPPDVCGAPELTNKHLSSQLSSTSYGRSRAFRHNSVGDGQEDEGDGDYNSTSGDGGGTTSESDPEDNQNRRHRSAALRPVNRASSLGPECTSSECAQQQLLLLRPSKAGEKLRRPSADSKVDPRPKRSHSFVAAERTNGTAEEEEDEQEDDELSQNDEFNGDASAGVALLADHNTLVSRWSSGQSELKGSAATSGGKTRRRRSKRQRQRNGKPAKRALDGCAETAATAVAAPSSQRHQTTSSLQESVLSSSHQLHSCADSGLGSSRADVPPAVQPRRSGAGRGVTVSNAQIQQFIQQQQQQYPHLGNLSGETLASNSVSLTSVLPGINVVSSPLATRHYGSNSVTPLGGFLHAHPHHQHFAAFSSLSDQASVSTAINIASPYPGVCASSEDTATMQGSQSGAFGSMVPGSPYHLYQPIGTTILMPPHHTGPSLAFPGSQSGTAALQPQFLGEHQVGLLQGGGGGGTQVFSPQFRSQATLQAEQKKQAPHHSETVVVSSGVNSNWAHNSAADQVNPSDVSTNPNWSETLKLKSAACPLPPVPSLPMPLTPITTLSTAGNNSGNPNNPYGDVQRDGTGSGRLSIYSVCM